MLQENAWIPSRTLSVGLNCIDEQVALIVGIKGQHIDPGEALRIGADMEFRTELCVDMSLAPDYGTHPRLWNRYDAVAYRVGAGIVHVLLLSIDRRERLDERGGVLIDVGRKIDFELGDISEVTAQVSELLADCDSGLFGTALLRLRPIEEIFAGTLPIYPRALGTGLFANIVNDGLSVLAGGVDELHILRIGDVRRGNGGIKGEGTSARFIIAIILIFREDRFVYRPYVLFWEALSKCHQGGCPERA